MVLLPPSRMVRAWILPWTFIDSGESVDGYSLRRRGCGCFCLSSWIRKAWMVPAFPTLINKRSGVAGLSGISSDMREIEAAVAAGNPRRS